MTSWSPRRDLAILIACLVLIAAVVVVFVALGGVTQAGPRCTAPCNCGIGVPCVWSGGSP